MEVDTMNCNKCGKDMVLDRIAGGYGEPLEHIYICHECHCEHHDNEFYGEFDVDIPNEVQEEEKKTRYTPW